MTKWLVADTSYVEGGKIEHNYPMPRPLIHLCCNNDHFGDFNVDADEAVNPDLVADVLAEDFPEQYRAVATWTRFASAFADTPWVESWRWNIKPLVRNMLKIADAAYVISPWLYGWKGVRPVFVHVSWRPGINHPILFVKYVRTEDFDG